MGSKVSNHMLTMMNGFINFHVLYKLHRSQHMCSTLLWARVPTIPSHCAIEVHACSMSLHVHSPAGLGVLPKDHRTLHVFKILLIAIPLLS